MKLDLRVLKGYYEMIVSGANAAYYRLKSLSCVLQAESQSEPRPLVAWNFLWNNNTNPSSAYTLERPSTTLARNRQSTLQL